MRHLLKRLGLLTVVLVNVSVACASFSSKQDIEPVYEWTEYITTNGVRIEYKYQECNNSTVRNQVLVLFRYTNLESESKDLSWKMKFDYNGECANCHRLDRPESMHEMTLTPGQTIVGDGTSKVDKRLYLFSNFVNLVPGMSDTKLTDFEFVELEVIPSNAQ